MDRYTGRLLLPWLRFSVRPEDITAQLAPAGGSICYVMERHSPLDEMLLQRACAQHGLPRPGRRLLPVGVPGKERSLLALSREVGFWKSRIDRRTPPVLKALLERLREDPAFDVTLVPVAVYWGRAPQRESQSWLRLLLAEDWALASRARRAMTVLFNGRNTVVQFGQGTSLRELADISLGENQARATHLAAPAVATGRFPYRVCGSGPLAPPHPDDRGAARAGGAHADRAGSA